jgi:hypothetical protein
LLVFFTLEVGYWAHFLDCDVLDVGVEGQDGDGRLLRLGCAHVIGQCEWALMHDRRWPLLDGGRLGDADVPLRVILGYIG